MMTDTKDETTSDLEIRWPEPKWVARGQGAAMNPDRVNQLAAAMRQELVVGEWLQLVIELFGDDEDEMLGGLFAQGAWEKLGLLYKFGGSDARSAGWNAALDAAREMLASNYKAGPPAEGAIVDRRGYGLTAALGSNITWGGKPFPSVAAAKAAALAQSTAGEGDLSCRTCGERYSPYGDGYDGECPACADRTDQALHDESDDEEQREGAVTDGEPPLCASDVSAFRKRLVALEGFTPGPWEVFSFEGAIGVTPAAPGDADVAHCDGFCTRRSEDVVRANAGLMAASPELQSMGLRLCDEHDRLRRAVAHANDHADAAIAEMEAMRAEMERLRAENARLSGQAPS